MFTNPKHSTAIAHQSIYDRQHHCYIPKVSASAHRQRWIKSIRSSLLSDRAFFRITNAGSILPNKRVTLSLFAFIATKDGKDFYQLCRRYATTKLSVYIENVKYADGSSNVIIAKGTIQNKSIDSNLYIDSDVASKLGIDNDPNRVTGFIPCIGTKIQFRYDVSHKRRSEFKGIIELCWLEGHIPIKLSPPPQLLEDPSL